jgi:hypothetical protein
MRRSDREIHDRAEIDAIIRDSMVCRLGLADAGGPYIVPVAFGYDGNALYFHTAPKGRKVACFLATPRVCFEIERNVRLLPVDDEPCGWTFFYECVIGYGAIAEIKGGRAKTEGLNRLMEHYSGRKWSFPKKALQATAVWRLDIETLTAKRAEEKTG